MKSIGTPTNFNNKFFTRYFTLMSGKDIFHVGEKYTYTWKVIYDYPIECVSVEKMRLFDVPESVFYTTFAQSKKDFIKGRENIDVFIAVFRQEIEF